jgi:hypothetical protein
MAYGERLFQIDFDFISHRLLIVESGGGTAQVELEAKTVARFYREVMAGLRSLDLEVSIHTTPVEVVEAIPFEEDEVHHTYEPAQAHAFWKAMSKAHVLLAEFAARFVGKVSPVQFYWGSFDLAVSRFSGRRAPTHPGGAPNCPPWVMEEAYSHELSSAGWWPLNRELGPAFYAYMYPEPAGYREAAIRPAEAYFDATLGEFILRHDDVRILDDPDEAVRAFLYDTYSRGADLANWPRGALESPTYPSAGVPRDAWSTASTASRDSGRISSSSAIARPSRTPSLGDWHRRGGRPGPASG